MATEPGYPCCEHCAEDPVHDIPENDHSIPCNAAGPCSTRPDEKTVWTESEQMRVALERVKALAYLWERRAPDCHCGHCQTDRDHANLIRAAIEGPRL